MKRGQILAIDALRFAAAMSVVLYHLGASAALHASAPIHLFAPAPVMPGGGVGWTWAGWVGVEVFFVISGYVIARSGRGVAPGVFLRRRALRLAPAAWVCASATALVLLGSGSLAPGDVVGRWWAAVLFLPTVAPIDGSYWTLEVECVFYLLAALALCRADDRGLERFGVRLGLASATFWAVALGAGLSAASLTSSPFLPLTMMPYGAFFALGIVIAAAHEGGWSRARTACALLFGAAGAVEITVHAAPFASLRPDLGSPVVPILLFALGIAAIVGAPRLQAPFTRIGPARLATLGLMTYPLYLLHQVIGAALMAGALRCRVPAPAAVAVVIALMLAAAWLVSARAEPAVRAWLRRLGTVLARRRSRHPGQELA